MEHFLQQFAPAQEIENSKVSIVQLLKRLRQATLNQNSRETPEAPRLSEPLPTRDAPGTSDMEGDSREGTQPEHAPSAISSVTEPKGPPKPTLRSRVQAFFRRLFCCRT